VIFRATIFACFNSAESGNFARGEVTTSQLRDMGNKLDMRYMNTPETEEYMRMRWCTITRFAWMTVKKVDGMFKGDLYGEEPKRMSFLL
jgi:hypothetical protein